MCVVPLIPHPEGWALPGTPEFVPQSQYQFEYNIYTVGERMRPSRTDLRKRGAATAAVTATVTVTVAAAVALVGCASVPTGRKGGKISKGGKAKGRRQGQCPVLQVR